MEAQDYQPSLIPRPFLLLFEPGNEATTNSITILGTLEPLKNQTCISLQHVSRTLADCGPAIPQLFNAATEMEYISWSQDEGTRV